MFQGKNRARRGNLMFKVRLAIAAIVIVAMVIGSIVLAISKGFSKEIYLLNGLSEPYSVSLNGGEPIRLAPGEPVTAKVGEGDTRVEVVDGPYEIDPGTATIRTNFFMRAFTDPVFVINPDRTAILEWEKIYYVPDTMSMDAAPEGELRYHTGELLHSLGEVNFPFRTAPDQLELPDDRRAHPRTVLEVVDAGQNWNSSINLMIALRKLEEAEGANAVTDLLRERLRHEPERQDLVAYFASRAKMGEFESFARPYLDERPFNVTFHQIYQDTASDPAEVDAVREEYRRLAEENPGDSGALFLAARFEVDPLRMEPMLERAVEAEDPHPGALRTMAFYRASCGRYQEAVELYRLAWEALREQDQTMATEYVFAAIGSGDYDLAGQILDEQLAAGPDDLSLAGERCWVYGLQGDRNGANALIRRQSQFFEDRYGPEFAEVMEESMQEAYRWGAGEGPAIYAEWEADGDVWERFIGLLYNAKLDEALIEVADYHDEYDQWDYSVLAAISIRLGRTDVAADYRERLASYYDFGDAKSREYARALRGESQLSPTALAAMPLPPPEKIPALLVLGEMQPENRQLYWEIVRRLNLDPRYAGLLINRLIGQS